MMRILVAEDERLLSMNLRDTLKDAGYEVACCANGDTAWKCALAAPPHLLISDVKMPGMDGMELLRRTRAQLPSVAVILMTTYASVQDAVGALQAGAVDYLVKPFDMAELLERVRRVAELVDLRQEKVELERRIEGLTKGGLFLGTSPAMRQIWAAVDRIAPLEVDVLIEGETGTGKEVLAKAIHAASSRAQKPFVALSCAVLSGSLLENELFGHEKGAFTGAEKLAIGRIEAAGGGTLFLDDVDDIPLDVQPKILRVLQERQVERLGSHQLHAVDFRLVSATKKNLPEEIARARFRQDLYYRLHVVHLHLPPLAERRQDILPLAGFFMQKHAAKRPCPLPSMHPDAARLLLCHPWPGNIRELEHAVQSALALCDGPLILPQHLPREISRQAPLEPLAEIDVSPDSINLKEVFAQTERKLLSRALDQAQGNQSEAAARLGIPRSTFQYRWRKLMEPEKRD